MNIYKSDYPNQVHQLSVSVSKHIYVTGAGKLKFQKKKFELDLASVRAADRVHVLHYLIRDHFSGAFYAEICASTSIVPVQDFLNRAWSLKLGYLFCGVPDLVFIPKTVLYAFENVQSFVESLDVEVREPTSGFQAGVRDVRTWDDALHWQFQVDEEDEWGSLERAQSRTLELVADLNGPPSQWRSKIHKWASPKTPIRVPSGREYRVSFDDEGPRLIRLG